MGLYRPSDKELLTVAEQFGLHELAVEGLHDHVIEKLFAAGMDLQGSIARARSPELVERLTRTVDDLQATIDEIRSTILGLQHTRGRVADFRQRIQGLIAKLTADRPIATTLRMLGPMTGVDGELAEHAEAVLTEAISNTVRHSGASRLTIELTAADELAIDLVDNGRGIPADTQRRSGLANMARRAEQLGGTCQITTPAGGGTHVRWSAPLFES